MNAVGCPVAFSEQAGMPCDREDSKRVRVVMRLRGGRVTELLPD